MAFLVFGSLKSRKFQFCLNAVLSVVFLARWSAMLPIMSSKLVGISCLSLSSRCCSLL